MNDYLRGIFYWKLMFFFVFIAIVLFSGDVAFAASSDEDVIGETLCKLVANLTGGIARSIATIAVFAVGVGLFLGKINWGVGAATTAGVAIVFGAEKIASWLAPNGESWVNCDAGMDPG